MYECVFIGENLDMVRCKVLVRLLRPYFRKDGLVIKVSRCTFSLETI